MAAPPTKHPPTAAVPRPLSIDQALQQSDALARLAARLRDSQARWDCVAPALPAALRPHLRPGPLDEAGWTVLASNPAVAAKARQLVPTLDAALRAGGWQAIPIRVRIQPAL
jgi:hypothetical protein